MGGGEGGAPDAFLPDPWPELLAGPVAMSPLQKPLFRASLRDLTRRAWQAALMIVGISLGVSVVIAIDLANSSASRAFSLSTETVVGRATHQIRGDPDGVPIEVYRWVRLHAEVQAAAPVVEFLAVAPDLEGRPLRILGIDPFTEEPFRGQLGGGMLTQAGAERFFTEPGTALIPSTLAEQAGLKPGDSLRLQIGGAIRTVEILGVLVPAENGGAGQPDNLVWMDIAGAQELRGDVRTITRVDLIATDEQAAALAVDLPPGVRVVPASELSETASQLTAAFQLNLSALSLLALVVGVFLIYNTMMFSVVQRRRVIGILRSLGATSDAMFLQVVTEAALVSAAGTAAGVGLGWLLGQGAVRLVTQTINDLYFVVSVRNAPLTVPIVVKGCLLGLGAGVFSAAGPALEAARVSPLDAMRRSYLEARAIRWLPWVGAAGAALGIVGVSLLALSRTSLPFSFAGMFAILFGLALLVPLGTVLLMRWASRPLARMTGALGTMAARTIVRAISRTGVAIAALMVALSVTIGVGLMIESFRSTVANWLELTLRADMYISSPAIEGVHSEATLPPELPAELAAVPGVAAVESFREVEVPSEFGVVHLSVADAKSERDARLFRFARGTPAQVWEEVLGGAVIVSEPFAYWHDVPAQGGTVTFYTDEGAHTFPVAGVYYDYAAGQGAVLMSENVFRQYWSLREVSSVGVYLSAGADLAEVEGAIRQRLAGTGLEVRANQALRRQALEVFDRTFAITAALRLLAVLVAFIGVLSALLALQLERSRELATLRALGLPPAGLWRLGLMETGLMGGAAGLFSLPTGLVLALVLIYVINLRSFGWTMHLSLSPGIFLQALGLGLFAALAAGIYPLVRLGRLEVAEALRQE